jgi:hypothetical protein
LFGFIGTAVSQALGLAIRIVAILLSIFGVVVAAAGDLFKDLIYKLIYAH